MNFVPPVEIALWRLPRGYARKTDNEMGTGPLLGCSRCFSNGGWRD